MAHKKKESWAEPLCSIPWQCGDASCKSQWHKKTYWLDTGIASKHTVDRYSDGDHEACSRRDLPTAEQELTAWREYDEYVFNTGVDPLNEFQVGKPKSVRERWEFKFGRSILGYIVVQSRRAGIYYEIPALPQHVREFLNLKSPTGAVDRGILNDFSHEVDDRDKLFTEAGLKERRWSRHTIERPSVHSDEWIKRELRKMARKAIRSPYAFHAS